MKVAFVGRPGLGAVEMRGRAIAQALGVEFVPLSKIGFSCRWDVIVLTKYWDDHALRIRNACDRLLYDPLDVFEGVKPHRLQPDEFWAYVQGVVRADVLIATSPSCAELMWDGTQDEVPIATIPHHADPRIDRSWHDPRGPMVYAGGERFIKDVIPQLKHYAAADDKEFIVRSDRDCWQALKGAGVVYIGRHGKSRTELAITSKPQVKLENAIAAGCPVYAYPEPAMVSLLESRGIEYSTNSDGYIGFTTAQHKPITLADSVEQFRALIFGGRE